jgi:hypothetical protein
VLRCSVPPRPPKRTPPLSLDAANRILHDDWIIHRFAACPVGR